jgi:acid phosphatase class B
MKRATSLIALAVATAFAVSADEPKAKAEKQYTGTQVLQLLEDNIRADALGALIVLNELREGRTNSAFETLEFEIDTVVVTAWHRVQSGTEDQKTKAVDFLKAVKEYRAKHPRKQEAKLGEGLFQQNCERTTAEAEKILKEMK